MSRRASPVERVCALCGATFARKASRRQVYCSLHCSSKANAQLARRLTYRCPTCGTSFEARASRERRFCSRACVNASRRGSSEWAPSKTHGHFGDRTYSSWCAMKQRCLNQRHLAFARYAGRGITICERWMTFENFLADMGERPSGKTLDRIDNDRGYEPGNCRWATRRDQGRNTRSVRLITYRGESRSLAEWAEILGFDEALARKRLATGWPFERAIDPRPLKSEAALRRWRGASGGVA
jgi:endogenous inhibitor of DNA gyrase (YacG/DUF329 family)